MDQAPTFAISKVVVTLVSVNASKINSSKLYVASDAGFTTDVQEVPVTITAAGDIDFTVPTPGANLYYKLEFDCASHSSNGFVQVSKVTYKAQ